MYYKLVDIVIEKGWKIKFVKLCPIPQRKYIKMYLNETTEGRKLPYLPHPHPQLKIQKFIVANSNGLQDSIFFSRVL